MGLKRITNLGHNRIIIVAGFVVILVLYFVISSLIIKKRREFGIQKAIGYRGFAAESKTPRTPGLYDYS